MESGTSAIGLHTLSSAGCGLVFLATACSPDSPPEPIEAVVLDLPASNATQVSLLRLVNPASEPVSVTITGVDDTGASPGDRAPRDRESQRRPAARLGCIDPGSDSASSYR